MSRLDLKITIEGTQCSGKSHIAAIIIDAMRTAGYSHAELLPTPWAEDRHMLWDDYHTISLEEIQTRKEAKP